MKFLPLKCGLAKKMGWKNIHLEWVGYGEEDQHPEYKPRREALEWVGDPPRSRSLQVPLTWWTLVIFAFSEEEPALPMSSASGQEGSPEPRVVHLDWFLLGLTAMLVVIFLLSVLFC